MTAPAPAPSRMPRQLRFQLRLMKCYGSSSSGFDSGPNIPTWTAGAGKMLDSSSSDCSYGEECRDVAVRQFLVCLKGFMHLTDTSKRVIIFSLHPQNT